jgi:predicted small secreted protein
MKIRKMFVIVCLIVLVSITLAACGTANPMKGVALGNTGKVYGFLNGLWDGFTALFAFIGNLLLGGHWGIYQVHNNGNWYDFGYLIGVSAFFGGSAGSAASSRRS